MGTVYEYTDNLFGPGCPHGRRSTGPAPGAGADVVVDDSLSDTSENPVQNKAVKKALDRKADASSLAAVATSGSYDDLAGKPTIPAAVTIDPALDGTSANPVSNSAVKAALDGKCSMSDVTATGTVTLGWTFTTSGATDPRVTDAIAAGRVEIEYAEEEFKQDGTEEWSTEQGWRISFLNENGVYVAGNGSAFLGYGPHLVHGTESDATVAFPTIKTLEGEDSGSVTAVRVMGTRNVNGLARYEDLSGFIKQHQRLTPMYSASPAYSGWTFEPAEYNGDPIEMSTFADTVWPSAGGGPVGAEKTATPGSVMRWTSGEEWYGDVELVATPIRTDVVGYTLGDQASMPLQPKGNYLTAHQDVSGKADVLGLVDVQVTSSTTMSPPRFGYPMMFSANNGDIVGSIDSADEMELEPDDGGYMVYHHAAGSADRFWVGSCDSSGVFTAWSGLDWFTTIDDSDTFTLETVTVGSAALADRKVNRITGISGTLTLSPPGAVAGTARQFLLCTSVPSGASAPTLDFGSGATFVPAPPALADGSVVRFTEIGTDKWLVEDMALYQSVSGKENVSNKVTSISAASTDAQYPSAKCVYDIVGDVEAALAQINGTANGGGQS